MAEKLEDMWLFFAACMECADGPPAPIFFSDLVKRTDWANSHVERNPGHYVTIWNTAATVLYEDAKRNHG